jgi:hypothetical protein
MSKYINNLINPITLKPYQNIPIETIKILKNLKYATGLYFLYNQEKELKYIGKSYDLCSRIKSSAYNKRAYYFKYLETKHEADADVLEPYFVAQFKPFLNSEFNTNRVPTIKIKFAITEPEMDFIKIYDFSDGESDSPATDYFNWQTKRCAEISDGPYGELTPETESGPDKPPRSGVNG